MAKKKKKPLKAAFEIHATNDEKRAMFLLLHQRGWIKEHTLVETPEGDEWGALESESYSFTERGSSRIFVLMEYFMELNIHSWTPQEWNALRELLLTQQQNIGWLGEPL